MAMVTIILPAPVAASRVRHAGKQHWHDDAYADWLSDARTRAMIAWRGKAAMIGPVALAMLSVLPRPVKRPKWAPADQWKAGVRIDVPVRPDVDNYMKAVLDGLQTGMQWSPLADDNCITVVMGRKLLASVTEDPCTIVGLGTPDDLSALARLIGVKNG